MELLKAALDPSTLSCAEWAWTYCGLQRLGCSGFADMIVVLAMSQPLPVSDFEWLSPEEILAAANIPIQAI
ncbi:hypothetical protein AVEN_70034-1 [Araneus ventricosus]|uniref:Uncharacterized protein n=1 Tax=Araneus ventricosus TaxID=182803 RepID=A0A4Y2WNF5_ARAVE|nr:hypothetical protein AVEN_70034-1 [Araneus ventricosus]